MRPLICECLEYVDPYNVCKSCGYPLCETDDCICVPGCDHNFADANAVPKPLKKKLRLAYSSGNIEYHRGTIQCFDCEQQYCEECYNEFAIRYTGYQFTPQTAFKYSKEILDAAIGLYLVNKKRDFLKGKLPKEILLRIINVL